MTRLITVAACLVTSALATSAFAETQAEIAEKYNKRGKELLFKEKYTEATAEFRQALARVPGEPKYFVNLCTSLLYEGKFGDALTACNAVGNNNPAPEQRTMADRLIAEINKQAKAQGIVVEPAGGGGGPTDPALNCTATPDDPGCAQPVNTDICKSNPQDPSCAAGGPPPASRAVGRPPSGPLLYKSTTPDNKYTWTLGVDGFGGGGSIGRADVYGTAAIGLRIKGDYLLNPASRFGAQAYLQITHFGPGEMQSAFVDTLDIIDLGLAAYKHLCPRSAQRLCLTPLAGVQIAMMSPRGDNDGAGSQVFNYAAGGARLELGAHYAFGTSYEHVLGVMVGANFYTKVFSGPEDSFDGGFSIVEAGLDKGGAAAYLGLGYTYRFQTPLGSAPFITLQ